MWQETFSSEAHKCRELALQYSGPQQRLLINLAAAFEELARKRNRENRFSCWHEWLESSLKRSDESRTWSRTLAD